MQLLVRHPVDATVENDEQAKQVFPADVPLEEASAIVGVWPIKSPAPRRLHGPKEGLMDDVHLDLDDWSVTVAC